MLDRKETIAADDQLISSKLNLSDEDEIKRQLKAANEYFTEDEKDKLQDYLSNQQDFSSSTFYVKEITIPIN